MSAIIVEYIPGGPAGFTTTIELVKNTPFLTAGPEEITSSVSILGKISDAKKITSLGGDHHITRELVQKCRQLFAYYIKKRLGTLTCFHDLPLTMEKIILAAEAIRACDDYAEQTLSSEGLKAKIKEIFKNAIKLEKMPGKWVQCRDDLKQQKSDYPGGSFGCLAKEAFCVFHPELYESMQDYDAELDRLHEEYLERRQLAGNHEMRSLRFS
jgi:hypothetical protein